MELIKCIGLADHNSLYEMLTNYFNGNNPETQYQNGIVQCDSGRRRSFDDMLLLSKNYYPETTIEVLVNTFKKYVDNHADAHPFVLYCSDIEKPVITFYKYATKTLNDDDYANDIFRSDAMVGKGKSQWSGRELNEMIDENYIL